MKHMLFLVPLCVIIGALLACGASDTNTGTSTTPSANTPTTSKHFTVGETVKVGDTWQVVVNSVKTNAGDQFVKPTKGTFVVVNISLKNISSKEQNLSSMLGFKFKGTDGTAYNETYLTGAAPSPNGKVEAGGITRGDLVYDVPTDQKSFTLAFSPDTFSGGQTIWDVKL